MANLHDILILRANADVLNTEVLNKTFTIKTVFGNVKVKRIEIIHITMEGRGLPDELITTSSDILKGTIQDKILSARISTGQVAKFKLPKDVISIQFLDNVHARVQMFARRSRRKRRIG